MTVKELAEFTGKTERAVRNWVNRAAEKNSVVREKISASSPMNPADYEVDEIELILNESKLGQNAVLIIMENARRNKNTDIVDTKSILSFMAQMQKQQQEFMTAVLNKLDGRPVQGERFGQKQLAPPKDPNKVLNSLVYKYAVKYHDGIVSKAWGDIYEEIYLRIGKKIRILAHNQNITKIKVIENLGLIDVTISIVNEIMGE